MWKIIFNTLFFRSRKAILIFPALFISFLIITGISFNSLCHADDYFNHKENSLKIEPTSNEPPKSFSLSANSGKSSVSLPYGSNMKFTSGFQC